MWGMASVVTERYAESAGCAGGRAVRRLAARGVLLMGGRARARQFVLMAQPPPIRIPLSHLVGPPDADRRYRLLELARRCARERRYSRRTEEAYVHRMRRFVLFHDRRHPRDLGVEHVRAFLNALAAEHHVAPSTQNQALCALVFLYDHVLLAPLRRVE